MSIHITSTNVESLIRKSSVFTTGGGLDVKRQIDSLHKIREHMCIPLLKPEELNNSDLVCSVTEIGNPEAPPLPKEQVIAHMVQTLEHMTGKQMKGFFPPEVGQESILIESAYYAGLPLIDFDPAGFRAVPFVDISIFRLEDPDIAFTPAIIATDYGEIITIPTPISYDRAETMIRTMTTYSQHGCVLVLGEIKTIKELKRYSKQSTISYHSMLENVQSPFKNNTLDTVCIVVKKREFEHTGFFCEVITLQSQISKLEYTVCVLNEAVILYDEQKKLIASVPERILLIDPVHDIGRASVDLSIGIPVRLVVLPPEGRWSTKQAHTLFGLERFQFFREYIHES